MKKVWIIGAGRFGKKAVSAVKKHFPESGITVVDHCRQACRSLDAAAACIVCMDGISYLYENLTRDDAPDWIIPVIPVHVAYEWIRLQLSPECSVVPADIPEKLYHLLPNVFPGKIGEIFASYADFVCPENCPEPRGFCTFTRKPRKKSLHAVISDISCEGFSTIAIQSEQLAPGIGGIRPRALFSALQAVRQSNLSVLIGTACKCHGVVQAFRKIETISSSS